MNIIGNLHIYWINLNRSYERKEFMINQFSKYNIKNTKRIEAVDGDNLDTIFKEKDYLSQNNKKLNNYEKACTLSHIKAIKTAYDDELEYVIIMEDDCSFKYLIFQEKSINELLSIDKNIDLIQLMLICHKRELYDLSINSEIIINDHKLSTGAYVITRNGMKKIINDDYYNNLLEADYYLYNKLNTYMVTKPYFRDNIKYKTQIHITNKENDDHDSDLHTFNTKFWDKYYFMTMNKEQVQFIIFKKYKNLISR